MTLDELLGTTPQENAAARYTVSDVSGAHDQAQPEVGVYLERLKGFAQIHQEDLHGVVHLHHHMSWVRLLQ